MTWSVLGEAMGVATILLRSTEDSKRSDYLLGQGSPRHRSLDSSPRIFLDVLEDTDAAGH